MLKVRSVYIEEANCKEAAESFGSIARKTDVVESLLIKFQASVSNSTKRESHHGYFPGRTTTFQSISRLLFLTVISPESIIVKISLFYLLSCKTNFLATLKQSPHCRTNSENIDCICQKLSTMA